MTEAPGDSERDPTDAPESPEAAAPAEPAPEPSAAPAAPAGWPLVKRGIGAFLDWFWTNAVVVVFGVWLVGQVWRDGSRWTARCFIVPSVAVAAVLLATALLSRLCRCRRIALAALVLSVPPIVSALLVENRWWPPRPQGDPARQMRLVHWNVGGAGDGWGATLAKLKALEPDACVLSEVYRAEATARIAAALGTEFTCVHQHNMLLVARGRTRLVLKEERIPRRAYFVEWESPHGALTVVLADAPSTYYHYRLLRDIRDRLVTHQADLAAGDLNGSRRLRSLAMPKGYAHAYDAVGTGWSATWPEPWPLWDIDQCILGPRIQPIRYRLQSTGLSDHRLGVLDFSVAQPSPSDPAASP